MEFLFENNKALVRALGRVLSEWLGTPYRHRCCVKYKGCDCIHFVAGVLDDLGIYKYNRRKMPQYPKDWHLHNTRELLYEETKRQLNVVDIDPKLRKFMDGDILLSTYGKAASHSAIFYKGDHYQSVNYIGVTKVPIIEAKTIKNLTYQLRLVK